MNFDMSAWMGAPNGAANPAGAAPAASPASGWMSDISSLANFGGNIWGLINAGQNNNAANTVFQQSNPFGAYRPYYGKQLLDLMQNPSSVSKLPGYQFLMDQGTQAIARGANAPGGVGGGSGGEMMELEKYGQGLADQFYQQQIQTLSGLAGANISPANPYQALLGKGGAASSIGSSVAGLANSASGVANLLSKLFGGSGGGGGPTVDAYGNPISDPNSLYVPGAGQGGNASYDFNSSIDYGGSSGYDPSTGINYDAFGGSSPPIDTSGLFSYPSAAGGEAANLQSIGMPDVNSIQMPNVPSTGPGLSTTQEIGTAAGAVGAALGIESGLSRGGLTGYTGAALNSANLANDIYKLANNGTPLIGGAAGGALGIAGGALGIYSGLKQGGVTGYTSATLGAANTLAGVGQLAGGAAAGGAGSLATIGSYAGPIGLALAPALYGASKPSVELGSDYWNRVIGNLQGNPDSMNINYYDSRGYQSQIQANIDQAKQGLIQDYLSQGPGTSIPENVLEAYPGGAAQFYQDVSAFEEQAALAAMMPPSRSGGSSGRSRVSS